MQHPYGLERAGRYSRGNIGFGTAIRRRRECQTSVLRALVRWLTALGVMAGVCWGSELIAWAQTASDDPLANDPAAMSSSSSSNSKASAIRIPSTATQPSNGVRPLDWPGTPLEAHSPRNGKIKQYTRPDGCKVTSFVADVPEPEAAGEATVSDTPNRSPRNTTRPANPAPGYPNRGPAATTTVPNYPVTNPGVPNYPVANPNTPNYPVANPNVPNYPAGSPIAPATSRPAGAAAPNAMTTATTPYGDAGSRATAAPGGAAASFTPQWRSSPSQPNESSGTLVELGPPPNRRPSNEVSPQSMAPAEQGSPRNNRGLPADPFGPPVGAVIPYDRAEIVARVGPDVILLADVSESFDEIRAQNKDRAAPEVIEAQLREIMKKRVEQRVEIKLLYQHVVRTVPSEQLPKIKEQVADMFEKKQVPDLMKQLKVDSRRDLEEKMASMGTSLDSAKRNFTEEILGHEWLRQEIKPDEEISHDEMLAWYHNHVAEFERPARVRWEQLTIRVARFPGKREAYEALCAMGNDVLRGVPFAEVAKAKSHGPTASEGGMRDWTTQGTLISKPLDAALFGLPVRQLSQIIDDDQAMHIVRIVERQDTVRTPFLEAQVKVREKIREERINGQKERFVARLRRQIPVWTIFDREIAAKPVEGQLKPW